VRTMQRTKHGLRIGGLLALAASALIAQSAASQGERLTVEVGECVDLPTPEQRLACFEAHVEAARSAPAAAPPAPTSAPPAPAPSAAPAAAATSAAAPVTTTIAVPATTSTAPAEFGFRERPEEREDAPPPPEVRAKVTELRETVPNAYLITLDNGQVWRQTQPETYLSLRVGNDVRIYFSRWRTYRLESPQMRGFLQVERVR
jgi:hypothetical protein